MNHIHMIHLIVLFMSVLFVSLLLSDIEIEGFYPYDLYELPPFAMRLYDGPYIFSGVVEDPFGEKYRYAPPYMF